MQTLTRTQLKLGSVAVSYAPDRSPTWGLAWVRFGDTDVRCTVTVKRWTPDAVGVEFEVDGETMRCWVWQGAVSPLASRNDAWL